MKDITPNTKLSKEQRRVAISRVLEKQSVKPPSVPPMGMSPRGMSMGMSPMGMNKRMLPSGGMSPMPMPMPQASSSLPLEEPSQDIMEEEVMEKTSISPAEERIQNALIADQLWKDGGGDDSLGAKIWEEFHRRANSKHLDTARDYFISSFVKWKADPIKYAKAHKQEADLLSQLSNEFDASLEGEGE